MSKYIDTTNLISDFLNDRLSNRERAAFLKLYATIVQEDPEDAGVIFDDIQKQIDALSEQELSLFFSKIDASVAATKQTNLFTFERAGYYVKYAAAILIFLAVSVWFYKNFLGTDSSITYIADADEMIWLPDSSSVLLKGGSTLIVESAYGKESRQITLKGEGFFDVRPDKTKPFIVSSPSGFFTKVLGTSFLMSTYDLASKVEVTTGIVEVGDVDRVHATLSAGDKLLKDINGEVAISRKVQEKPVEILEFQNQELRMIASRLTEVYGINIIIKEGVPLSIKSTGTFSSDQPVEDIIMTICSLHQLKYRSTPNGILISK